MVRLADAVQVNPRDTALRGLPDDTLVTFVPMAAVEAAGGSIALPERRRLGEVRRGFTPFREGDIIWAKITPCMENGKAAIARGLENRIGFGSTEFHVLRPEPAVMAEWVFHFVRQASFREEAGMHFTGAVGQRRVPASFLQDYPIPIPPLSEQHRIVAGIEKHFSRLDAGVSALKRAQANLRRYRASILKAACEGRLVPQDPNDEPASELHKRILAERRARWEAEQMARMRVRDGEPRDGSRVGQYREPVEPDAEGLPELPQGWVWSTMPQLGELNRGKSKHRPRNDPMLYDGPYPFIQTGDVKHANGFIRSHHQTYNDNGLRQSRLWPTGTLCITIAANIAETGILTYPACFPDSVVGLVHDGDAVTVRFAELFLRTAREELDRWAPATAQKNINLDTLSSVAVPLPPLEEQRRIVAEVDRCFSVVDELESTIAGNLKRAERLRQAILKRAFEGRLVPQDPSDEPASVLLKRIRAERECADRPARGRKPMAAQLALPTIAGEPAR